MFEDLMRFNVVNPAHRKKYIRTFKETRSLLTFGLRNEGNHCKCRHIVEPERNYRGN